LECTRAGCTPNKKKKKKTKKKENSGGPDLTLTSFFGVLLVIETKKLVDPRRTQLPGMHSTAPAAMARRESATSS
jgi:hypothetical protein